MKNIFGTSFRRGRAEKLPVASGREPLRGTGVDSAVTSDQPAGDTETKKSALLSARRVLSQAASSRFFASSRKSAQIDSQLTAGQIEYFSDLVDQYQTGVNDLQSKKINKGSAEGVKLAANNIALLDAVLTHGRGNKELISQFESLQGNTLIRNFLKEYVIGSIDKESLKKLQDFSERHDFGDATTQSDGNKELKKILGDERAVSVEKTNNRLTEIRGQLTSLTARVPAADEEDSSHQNLSVFSEQDSFSNPFSVTSGASDTSRRSSKNSSPNPGVGSDTSVGTKNKSTQPIKKQQRSTLKMIPNVPARIISAPIPSDVRSRGSDSFLAENFDASTIDSANSSSTDFGPTQQSWASFDSPVPESIHFPEPESLHSSGTPKWQDDQSVTTNRSVPMRVASPVQAEERPVSGPSNEMLTRQSHSILDDLQFNQSNLIKKIDETDVSETVLKNNLEGLAKELEARIAEVSSLAVLNKNAPASDRAVRGLRLDMLRASADLASEHFRRLCEPGYTPDESRFFSRDNEKESVDMKHLLHEAAALPHYGAGDRSAQDIVKKLRQDNVNYQTKLESLANIIEKEDTVVKILANDREKLIVEARNNFDELAAMKNDIENTLNTGATRALLSLDPSIKGFLSREVLLHLENMEAIYDEINYRKNESDNLLVSVLKLKKASDKSVFDMKKENDDLKENLDILNAECQSLKEKALKIYTVDIGTLRT